MKTILSTVIFLFFILFVAYLAVMVLGKYDTDNNAYWERISNTIGNISIEVWNFVRPFVQLIVILTILEWLLNKFGINITLQSFRLEGNVQTVIALLVVSAFCLAALGSIPGMGALKDVALVVVGFYFGSHKNPLVTGKEKKSV